MRTKVHLDRGFFKIGTLRSIIYQADLNVYFGTLRVRIGYRCNVNLPTYISMLESIRNVQ